MRDVTCDQTGLFRDRRLGVGFTGSCRGNHENIPRARIPSRKDIVHEFRLIFSQHFFNFRIDVLFFVP